VPRQDLVGIENRKLFQRWGTKQVRQMVAAGHYEAEQRRPMLIWIAERDARSAKLKRWALIAGDVLAFVGFFFVLLGLEGA
jgi:hypothetical protein